MRCNWRMLTVFAALIVMTAGCATVRPFGDEEAVMNVVHRWQAATDALDVDAVLSLYAKEYADERVTTYSALKSHLERTLPAVASSGFRPDTSKVVVAVFGDTATAGPIRLGPPGNRLSFNLLLQKRDRSWLIVSSQNAQ